MSATDSPAEDRAVLEVNDHVLTITMVRHEKRNAIDGAMTLALDAALNKLDDDPDLWVGIITGGPEMFCAGTDMAATSGSPNSAASSSSTPAAASSPTSSTTPAGCTAPTVR